MYENKSVVKSSILKKVSLFGNDIKSKRQEIIEFFNNTYSLYEELFSFITDEGYYIQAEPLRHPLIFYFGHTATFIINKLIIAGFKIPRINPYFESIFAVGVDEMSWDDINTKNYDWPTVQEVRDYRDKVREFFNNFLENIEFTLPINWESPLWVVLMIAEHEKIHLETSTVIMRQLPLKFFKNQINNNDDKWKICNEMALDLDKVPQNQYIQIRGKELTIGKERDSDFYGWDNEYGKSTAKVNDFSVTKYLITNKEFLEFINDGGYSNYEYWTEEGTRWAKSQTLNRPRFWSEDHAKLRLFLSEIPMPWDWPVEVNYLEAKAYCNWQTKKTGKYTRLPLEHEWYILRGDTPNEELDANIELKHFASSCPVNKFEHNFGVYDVFGNVWQWSESTMDGFENFEVHPVYKDFSVPTYDGLHNLIKGGSWISTGNLSNREARYAFRRHFYQFCGFRCVQGDKEIIDDVITERQYDVTKWISCEYEHEMYGRFKLRPATKTISEDIEKFSREYLFNDSNKELGRKRILVLGTKTGGINFELLNTYDEVIGFSQTAYHFRIPVEMLNKRVIRYEVKEEGDINDTKKINKNMNELLEKIEKKEKVAEFYQTDLYNDICPKKYGKFNALFVYMLDDISEIKGVSLLSSLEENSIVFVMTPKGKNLSEEQFPSNRFKKLNLLNNTLNPKEHKILFRETARKHRLEVYEMHIFKVEYRENANSYYETDSLCEQYIRFHFGSTDTFPSVCGKKCLEVLEKVKPNKDYKNFLDIGCAVGQTSFYLANKFEKVNGLDFSKRFIEIAKERAIDQNVKNINFYNGSALALGEIDIPKDNSLVFCGNLIDRLTDPRIFLNDVGNYVEKGGLLVLTSPYTWLDNFTPKENWVGGTVIDGEILTTTKGLEIALRDNFDLHSVEDVEFLIPDTPPFMYQLTAAQMTVWIRK